MHRALSYFGLSYKGESHTVPKVKAGHRPLQFPFSHYPVKVAGTNAPLSEAYRSTPCYRQANKPPLSCFSPLLQNKVAFERRNSLRFCPLNTEKAPGAWTGNTAWLIPQALLKPTVKEVRSDRADKAQGQGHQHREHGGAIKFGSAVL